MKITLEPLETRDIDTPGYSFYLKSAPGKIQVQIDGEADDLEAGQGVPSNGHQFKNLRVKNLESTVQTIEYTVASNNRGLIDNQISGTINARQTPANTVTAGTTMQTDLATNAGTVIVAGNANRARLQLQADDNNVGAFWIGSTNGGKGIKLTAGGVYDEAITGDLNVTGDTNGDLLYMAEVV